MRPGEQVHVFATHDCVEGQSVSTRQVWGPAHTISLVPSSRQLWPLEQSESLLHGQGPSCVKRARHPAVPHAMAAANAVSALLGITPGILAAAIAHVQRSREDRGSKCWGPPSPS